MYTPYSKALAEESNRAHLAAQDQVYPALIGVGRDALEFIDCTGDGERDRILDTEMAVDRMVKITVPEFRLPITLTVQERFRKIEYARFRDLTITEWNPASGLPSEVYKITAGFFVYGYFDYDKLNFGEVVMVDTATLLRGLANGTLTYRWGSNPRSKQTFITVKFDDLARASAIAASYIPDNGQTSFLPDWLR